jgi:HEAT repeat protein
MAYIVFSQYPQVAEFAIPQFAAMLGDKDDLIKGKASLVLANIGRPAIPSLLATLSHTNDIARALAAFAIGRMGTNAIQVRPNLEAMLSDKSIFVRLDAAEAVGKMGGAPETIVPVLLQCFHEGDRDTGSYALLVLSALKERAKSAVPALTNSLAVVTNSDERYALLAALREIDPGEAARFDPPKPVATSTAPLDESDTNLDERTPAAKP